MKLLKKSALSKAMAVALLAGGMVASHQASALPDPGAGAVHVSPNGLGQALVYPYYTVQNGFKTAFNVFNTSSTHAVAVKVRFREYQNSRDVLDFNLVLSPNDKWSANVIEAADGTGTASNGGALLTTSDTSCTIPEIPATGAPFSRDGYSFSTFQDSGDQDFDRLKQGYIEIIPMAWSDVTTDTIYQGALHAQPSGIPANCATVRTAFTPTTSWDLVNTTVGDGSPSISSDADWEAIPAGNNPLFGELALINTDGGVAGGTNAVALADWMTGVKLTTAQEFPFYLEPTLAGADGLWTTTGLAATDAALTSLTVVNEWANNPTNGANVDWAVTFPTKSFHADVAAANIQAGSSAYRTGAALAPFENAFASGASEITVSPLPYGSEEGEATVTSTGTVSFSPGSFSTPGTPTFKYEANTVTFGGDSVLDSANPLALDPATDIAGDRVSGHVRMLIPGSAATGLPMVGFAMKERDTGNSSLSFGQILDHKFSN